MIPAWHLAWVIPLCLMAGGVIGVLCVALCQAAGRDDHER